MTKAICEKSVRLYEEEQIPLISKFFDSYQGRLAEVKDDVLGMPHGELGFTFRGVHASLTARFKDIWNAVWRRDLYGVELFLHERNNMCFGLERGEVAIGSAYPQLARAMTRHYADYDKTIVSVTKTDLPHLVQCFGGLKKELAGDEKKAALALHITTIAQDYMDKHAQMFVTGPLYVESADIVRATYPGLMPSA